MGRTFVNDLYYGRINPWERKRFRRTQCAELNTKIEREKGYFAGILSKEDYNRLEQLENLYTMQHEAERLESFYQGLKIGARFMEAVCLPDDESKTPPQAAGHQT